MEQRKVLRNISGTACVLGLALSSMSVNSTMVVNGTYKVPEAIHSYYDTSYSNSMVPEISNIYEKKASTGLEVEADALFGEMRDATPEEQASVNNYIKSISKSTGVNFFDVC